MDQTFFQKLVQSVMSQSVMSQSVMSVTPVIVASGLALAGCMNATETSRSTHFDLSGEVRMIGGIPIRGGAITVQVEAQGPASMEGVEGSLDERGAVRPSASREPCILAPEFGDRVSGVWQASLVEVSSSGSWETHFDASEGVFRSHGIPICMFDASVEPELKSLSFQEGATYRARVFMNATREVCSAFCPARTAENCSGFVPGEEEYQACEQMFLATCQMDCGREGTLLATDWVGVRVEGSPEAPPAANPGDPIVQGSSGLVSVVEGEFVLDHLVVPEPQTPSHTQRPSVDWLTYEQLIAIRNLPFAQLRIQPVDRENECIDVLGTGDELVRVNQGLRARECQLREVRPSQLWELMNQSEPEATAWPTILLRNRHSQLCIKANWITAGTSSDAFWPMIQWPCDQAAHFRLEQTETPGEFVLKTTVGSAVQCLGMYHDILGATVHPSSYSRDRVSACTEAVQPRSRRFKIGIERQPAPAPGSTLSFHDLQARFDSPDETVVNLIAASSEQCFDVHAPNVETSGKEDLNRVQLHSCLERRARRNQGWKIRMVQALDDVSRRVQIVSNHSDLCLARVGDLAEASGLGEPRWLQTECSERTEWILRDIPESSSGEFLLESVAYPGMCAARLRNEDGSAFVGATTECPSLDSVPTSFRISMKMPPEHKFLTAGDAVEEGGALQIVSLHGSRCLDLPSGSARDGTQLQLWDCARSQEEGNQGWRIRGLGFTASGNLRVKLVSARSNKCADVEGASTRYGAKLQQWSCIEGQRNQEFELRPVSSHDMSYELVTAHSNQCIDVVSPNRRIEESRNGARVQQWGCTSSGYRLNQLWRIRKRDQ